MPTFRRDGIDFRYHDSGTGLPVAFQHGLSGTLDKVLEVMPESRPFRLVSFDARYHGKTRPLGPPGKIGFDRSADDLIALLDHLEIENAVVGGISMGAGIALNVAARYPHRVLGLILSRPAWLDEPFPEERADVPRDRGPDREPRPDRGARGVRADLDVSGCLERIRGLGRHLARDVRRPGLRGDAGPIRANPAGLPGARPIAVASPRRPHARPGQPPRPRSTLTRWRRSWRRRSPARRSAS